MLPSTSSRVAKAMRLPLLVVLSLNALTCPSSSTRAPVAAGGQVGGAQGADAGAPSPGTARGGGPRGRSPAPPARRPASPPAATRARAPPARPARPAWRLAPPEHVEQRDLPFLAVALLALAAVHRLVERGEEAGPRALQRIERARLDQALDHAPVDQAQVDARAEVVERGEAAVRPRAVRTIDSIAVAPTFLIAAEPEVDRLARHA